MEREVSAKIEIQDIALISHIKNSVVEVTQSLLVDEEQAIKAAINTLMEVAGLLLDMENDHFEKYKKIVTAQPLAGSR